MTKDQKEAPLKTKPLIIKKQKVSSALSDNIDDLTVSFDVGIINLAYCIKKYTDNKLTIYDWNIINMADGNPKLLCSNQNCKRKAHYCKPVPMCLMHSKSTEGLIRNMTVANVTEYELKSSLFKALDSNPNFTNPCIQTVLIENQPTKGMEKIKGIGHSIFDYFVIRSLDNQRGLKHIAFIDAKNKLTVYDGPPLECNLKTQYARNKWYAKEYCRWVIKDMPYETEYFNNFGKKIDDLADCMLQGLWYLKFGQHGIKAPITSSHQKLVYRQNNIIKYNKVRAYAPKKAQVKLTLSNIKYLVSRGSPLEGALKSSIEFYFGTLEDFNGLIQK